MDEDVFNLEQAIKFFGVSERTMIKLLREERVPARKIGREWRFSKRALLEWLGAGVSTDYQSQAEQFRVAVDTKSAVSDALSRIKESINKLQEGGTNVREILPDLEEDIFLPGDATLRVSYKRQRELEKVTFKIFWLNEK